MCDIAILSPRSRCRDDAWGWHVGEWAEGAGELSHLHLHLVILQTLLSEVTYNWGMHKSDRGSARNTKSQALFKYVQASKGRNK